ncbi:hypothetical protein BO94DRAFT_23768 [Aspergillus sclerotioniger CBS 115572]|uniref:Uncharacterized protein n=1 Tax=Aspergillus sclerotioniger CBS 115572 TaxID=1450535 RepID=A0A317WWF7_9EURO|nr:hypothetical protein BO94DRAFT_23768 [Aspergillus sclerotioniger CBS 115572]PWY90385.1 hypothetical protein BO94DRAFT_23768 [Aspergillus sclerotioniger CBS 115572]
MVLPPMSVAKRPRIEHYPYPPIPQSNQDRLKNVAGEYNRPFKLRWIESLSLSQLGISAEVAIMRAELATAVTRENEGLIRSFHPSLASHEEVWVSESVFGPPVWVVGGPADKVEAAGQPIHFHPAHYSEYIGLSPLVFVFQYPHFGRDINPRRFLTRDDLDGIRECFPEAVGVEVLVAGFIVVLFEKRIQIKRAYERAWPIELGGLLAFFELANYSCTAAPMAAGVGVSTGSGYEHRRAGCMGLRLRLPDGSSAITTVTHGFVVNPSSSLLSQVGAWCRGFYSRIKEALMSYRPVHVEDEEVPPYLSTPDVLTNCPIGKRVWLANSHVKIGTITRTFDRPSAVRPYPAGYAHDLSLITDEALVELASPPGYPQVTEWGEYVAALEQQSVYAVCHHSYIDKWCCTTGTADGTLFKRATVVGSGYTWDKEYRTQNAFLLWHTGKEISPADGWSGSPLCLGRPQDATAKALVFQNLQRACRLGHSGQEVLIKGGFLLPAEIRKSEIESANVDGSRKFHTSPVRERSSVESYRRIVSGV